MFLNLILFAVFLAAAFGKNNAEATSSTNVTAYWMSRTYENTLLCDGTPISANGYAIGECTVEKVNGDYVMVASKSSVDYIKGSTISIRKDEYQTTQGMETWGCVGYSQPEGYLFNLGCTASKNSNESYYHGYYTPDIQDNWRNSAITKGVTYLYNSQQSSCNQAGYNSNIPDRWASYSFDACILINEGGVVAIKYYGCSAPFTNYYTYSDSVCVNKTGYVQGSTYNCKYNAKTFMYETLLCNY